MKNPIGFAQSVKQFWEWLKSQLPAIVISLFQWQESRIAKKDRENDALKLQLELEGNKNAIDKKYADMSDADIVLESLREGSGTPSGGDSQGDGTPKKD